MADNEIKVLITAQIDGIKQGAETASKIVNQTTENIKASLNSMNSDISSQMSKVSSSFSSIGTMAKALGGVLASVLSMAFLKESIRTTISYRESIEDLSRAMGITSSEASVLNVALRTIGVTSETYISANMKLSMQIKANEEALNALGVATRSSSGALVSQTELFNNAINTMMSYKAGADRNQFALYAFGRSASEVYNIMRLNNEVMESARSTAQLLACPGQIKIGSADLFHDCPFFLSRSISLSAFSALTFFRTSSSSLLTLTQRGHSHIQGLSLASSRFFRQMIESSGMAIFPRYSGLTRGPRIDDLRRVLILALTPQQ